MKRLIAMLLAALMLITMSALAEDADGKQDEAKQSELHMVPFADASARDTELMLLADELTMQMDALGSTQGYVEMVMPSGDMQDIIDDIVTHDYSAPRRSMVIFIDELAVDTFGKLMMVASGMKFDADNKELPGVILGKLLITVPNMTAAMEGPSWIIGSNILIRNVARAVKNVPAGIAYVINDYGEGVPYSWTSFEVSEDGAAFIVSIYVPGDNEVVEQLFEARGAVSIPGMELGMLPMSSVLYDRAEDKAE
ncbi:MAG: hypothetical protein ACOYIH_06065 [Candidatus Fimadaptatus sp.]|jgi:hypothetical protein